MLAVLTSGSVCSAWASMTQTCSLSHKPLLAFRTPGNQAHAVTARLYIVSIALALAGLDWRDGLQYASHSGLAATAGFTADATGPPGWTDQAHPSRKMLLE